MSQHSTHVTVFGRTEIGLVRKANEDALLATNLADSPAFSAFRTATVLEEKERGVLLAVSDGMGGHKAGDMASALALSVLQRELSTIQSDSPETALVSSVETANQEVWQAGQIESFRGMGATLTAVLIFRNFAYIAEIGDSRAYLIRGDRIFRLTHDQNAAQLLLDQGKISENELAGCQVRHLVLQAMGVNPTVTVALGRLTLRQGDKILLCSDGLSGKLKDQEILRIVTAHDTLQTACDQLVHLAMKRGGDDNITVLIGAMGATNLPAVLDPTRISLASLRSFQPEPSPALSRG